MVLYATSVRRACDSPSRSAPPVLEIITVGRVPRRRNVAGPPRSYLRSGEWPTGDVGADVAAEAARRVSLALIAALGDRSIRQLARDADVDHATVLALLQGQTWGDFVVLARLEAALGTRIWATPAADL